MPTASPPNLRKWPKWLVDALPAIYISAIFGLPFLLLLSTYQWLTGPLIRAVLILASPIIYSTLFMLIAGALSWPHQGGIIKGRFPRDSGHPVYGHRKLYGICWTALYYFKPVYWICLSVPILKRITFRVFGYKGNLDFTIYPDTWIRDLPLLDFGRGAYISNRATLGSNIVMPGNEIIVTPIVVGENSVVGHLACMAGVTIGKDVVVGIHATVGSHVHLHDNCQIGPCAGIDHGTTVGKGASIGSRSYTGLSSSIGDNAKLAANSAIKARTRITAERENGKLNNDGLMSGFGDDLLTASKGLSIDESLDRPLVDTAS